MQVEITPDQRFCTFDKTTFYIFVEQCAYFGFNPCKSCVFRDDTGGFHPKPECYLLPCVEGQRFDKKRGFWAICLNVDYQAFTKTLRASG